MSRFASLLDLFGVNTAKMAQSTRALPWFFKAFRSFKNAHAAAASDFAWGKLYPCLEDRWEQAGIAKGGYFHGDLLVARRIFDRNPARHADVASRVDGFVAHVASFRHIDVFDIRPTSSDVKNISFKRIDLMKDLDETLAGSYDSVSCLHALEHFGLGRYGDSLDYNGHLRGFEAISKIVAPNGYFYLSVPLGPQRIEFNAHRVFSIRSLREMCESKYVIERFSYVDDEGDLFENVPFDTAAADHNYDCHFGLAILELLRK